MSDWDASTIAIRPSQVASLGAAVADTPRCCSLVVYSGGDTGLRIALAEGASTIGRSAAARIQIDGPDMSRLHAELAVQDGQATLRDLGSANGSFVQDRRIGASPWVLQDGDRLRLGTVRLKFYEQHSLDAALHDSVYRMAMVDAGTGLFNRRYLQETLRRELRLTRQGGRPMAVIAIDLDRFKAVNDRHGHAGGDLVLRDCAAVLGPLVAAVPGATLGRQGGEEFLVLLPGVAPDAARALAERLRAAVAGHAFRLAAAGAQPVAHQQTISLGVAAWTAAMLDGSDLLDAADRQLYQAKRAGRDCVCG